MGKSKLMTAEEAVARIRDGDCITVTGTGGTMYPAKVINALEVRFLTEGHPRDLTWFDPFPTGVAGIEPLSHEGFLKRVIGGYFLPHPALSALINANKVQAYMYPLGTLGFWCQQMAAGRKGFLTQVGLDTYVDPRQAGGKLNAVTTEDLVTLAHVGGEEYLWFKELPITAALLRATKADEEGNLSLEEDTMTMSILHQAMAAKRFGGVVIAQVKSVVSPGAIHPRLVAVPGLLVDHIVVDPDQDQDGTNPSRQWLQQAVKGLRPPRPVLLSPDADVWRTWVVESKIHSKALDEPNPLTADKIIARRAALELGPGDVVNLGAGPPLRNISPVIVEEDVDPDLDLTAEVGVVGGIGNLAGLPVTDIRYFFDTPGIFSFYNAGLISSSHLGMMEFDSQGNMNNVKYGDTWVGPGGSMDIAQNVPKIVLIGSLTAGGLKVAAGDGRLIIVQEGKSARAVQRVQWVCLNGPKTFREGKEVLYITERAVFKLSERGPVLIEVAPGMDIERDVIGRMGFRPLVAPDLKPMDERIFRREPMGLKRAWRAAGG